MKTIKENIISGLLHGAEKRLSEFRTMEAPTCMIDAAEAKIADLKNGIVKVAHIEEFGHLEFSKLEVLTGRRGREYVSYTTSEGVINFFPNAKFGPFVCKQKGIQDS